METTEEEQSRTAEEQILEEEGPTTEASVIDKNEGSTISKRTEKKIANGMGFILQQLRSTGEEVIQKEVTCTEKIVEQEVVAECEEVPDNLQKLNRKERRALLQKRYEETCTEEVKTIEEPPTKIACHVSISYSLENPTLLFREEASFTEKVPTFGFASICSNNYVKLSKFSPNGQYIATTSQDRIARIFNFDEFTKQISNTTRIPLGDLPYDAVWHPCGDLLATTARHQPIHIFDNLGERKATYRGINHLDELDAAQTIAFSNDGLRLYSGYNKFIRIWDVRKPGRQQYEVKTWRKHPYPEGQKAIVSTIAVHPSFPGVYAVGTYGPTIGLYSDNTNFVECLFSGDFQAVTQIKYSSDGMKLYSCGRKTGTIQCFDLRNTAKILFTLHRPFETQQKVYFDIDSAEKYLFSGTSNGEIAIFDLQDGEVDKNPKILVKISTCSVPCVSLHPSLPIVAACTGERIFPFPKLKSMEESDDEEIYFSRKYLDSKCEDDLENTVQLWNFEAVKAE